MAAAGRVLVRAAALALLALALAASVAVGSGDAEAAAEPAAAPRTLTSTLSADGLSAEEAARVEREQTPHEFQAEVTRLMDILVNALYSKREVFLRELVSNGSDALDKLRYVLLTSGKASPDDKYEIRVRADAEAGLLTITDTGIGMTRDDLVANLGTIASSGTKRFMEKLSESKGDVSLIGQFGVGFYSAFVIADSVTVTTKHDDDPQQHIWHSTGAGFSITPDPRGNTLGRGTRITIAVRADAREFLEPAKLKELILHYSEFIDYPIYLWESSTVEREVPVDDDADSDAAADAEADADAEPAAGVQVDDDDDDDDDDHAGGEKRTKKVSETVWDWAQVNTQKPLWKRAKDEIEESEYTSFYKSMSKDYQDPLTWVHFKAEGEHEFHALLYIPSRLPENIFERMDKTTSIRLYVRRVFITDSFEDMIPRYLAFIFGIVDSDDMPLNVSREMLQQSAVIQMIKKKLTRKCLEMFKHLAESDEDKYQKFWGEFGKNVKLGIIEDQANRNRLTKLARFWSSKSGDRMTSLDDYVSRMHENQTGIFYIAGESLEAVRASPHLEQLLKRDMEVLYLVDAIDEYTVQSIPEFESHRFFSASKEGLKFGDETDEEKELEKEQKESMKPVLDFLKDTLKGKIDKVVLSKRLESSPVAIVTAMYGWSANMERIVKAQTLGDTGKQSQYMAPRKTLEINAQHSLIRELKRRVDANDAFADDLAFSLYDAALLTSGFNVDDASSFAQRMYRLLSTASTAQTLSPRAAPAQHDDDDDDVSSGGGSDEHEEL